MVNADTQAPEQNAARLPHNNKDRWMKPSLTALALVIAAAAGGLTWYLHDKQPQRDGELVLSALQAPVTVDYDERGVPHIRAEDEADMYRALGFVHAQDRLFQMELLRRLARGELAEVLGENLLPTDRLFRTLEIGRHADAYAARQHEQAHVTTAVCVFGDVGGYGRRCQVADAVTPHEQPTWRRAATLKLAEDVIRLVGQKPAGDCCDEFHKRFPLAPSAISARFRQLSRSVSNAPMRSLCW
jgi:uncharacterized membrane protein